MNISKEVLESLEMCKNCKEIENCDPFLCSNFLTRYKSEILQMSRDVLKELMNDIDSKNQKKGSVLNRL